MEKLFRICNVCLVLRDFTVLKITQQNAKNVLIMFFVKVKIPPWSYQDTGERPNMLKKYFLVLDLNHAWVELILPVRKDIKESYVLNVQITQKYTGKQAIQNVVFV
jgi:hypothetical protein